MAVTFIIYACDDGLPCLQGLEGPKHDLIYCTLLEIISSIVHMKNPRKSTFRKLHKIAERQQGFFTTKQALRAGFSARSQLYHVQIGDWIREYRGIYRLAQFPPADRPDLMRWYLWSRNNREIPEGVYSHETALSLYDLSDTMPARLHMSVAKRFRRNSQIPKALILHRVDLPPGDVDTIQGIRVAKPLRAITDLLAEGRISKDILIQTLREGLRRGLITVAALNKVSLPEHQVQELQNLIKRAR
jgi:predicted transcriptional regulator of viral defense system